MVVSKIATWVLPRLPNFYMLLIRMHAVVSIPNCHLSSIWNISLWPSAQNLTTAYIVVKVAGVTCVSCVNVWAFVKLALLDRSNVASLYFNLWHVLLSCNNHAWIWSFFWEVFALDASTWIDPASENLHLVEHVTHLPRAATFNALDIQWTTKRLPAQSKDNGG